MPANLDNQLGPIAVLGAGSWGTALALMAARKGHDVRLYGHESHHIEAIQSQNENEAYLPGIPFPSNLKATHSLAEALATDGEQVLNVWLVVPSKVFGEVLAQVAERLEGVSWRLLWGTKGLTPDNQLLHTQATAYGVPMGVLSGPSFAREVAEGIPTAITFASNDKTFQDDMLTHIHDAHFRIYTVSDVVGVQLGGVVKNVIAIAAGMADGLGFGANTRAALISRGLAELRRLGLAMGAEIETFAGLAGVGDLVLTCTDNQSRNRRFGLLLGRGMTAQEATDTIGQVIEGQKNAAQLSALSRAYGVEMPICEAVRAVLNDGITVTDALNQLLERAPRPETL